MLSIKDQKFINIALEECCKSNVLMRHGCVAVMNGKIIAQGHNSYRNRTNDGFINNQGSCHAEISVLRSIFHIHSNKKYENINYLNDKNHKNNKNIFKKISLYIVRCSYDLIFKNSAPCSECSKIIKLLDIKKIVYSNSNNNNNNNNFIIVKPQDYSSDYKTLGRKQIDYRDNHNAKNKLKKNIL